VREPIQTGRDAAALREPNFGELLGGPKRPRRPLEARRSQRGGRNSEPRISRMRMADILAGSVAAAAVLLVFVNALGLQRAPRPAAHAKPAVAAPARKPAVAPLPPARPEPVKRTAANLMLEIQRELATKGYYDGAVDGIAGPRAMQAIRDFEKANGLKMTGAPSEALLEKIRHGLSKSDITGSIAPAAPAIMGSRIGSVQRMLARYGFGPVRINGELDTETRTAIERFEQERELPPTGRVSDRVVHVLAEYSGHAPD
jgi:peptidoglycan hydrolase-like protein with peptidoglycan-binding domain